MTMPPIFHDRRHAGRDLAGRLERFEGRDDVVVLGLPRGGVPVAFEVARALAAPLDVIVVRKLGLPGHRELAMGAIASGGIRVLNEDVVGTIGVPETRIEAVAARERKVLERRERRYRQGSHGVDVRSRVTIVVDDGLATGATMRAAVAALRERGAASIVAAVPVGSPDVCEALATQVDEVVCAHTADPFVAVGIWYRDFGPTSDAEVTELLGRAGVSSVSGRSGGV
jgi:predicted phosphoribosyltransferase